MDFAPISIVLNMIQELQRLLNGLGAVFKIYTLLVFAVISVDAAAQVSFGVRGGGNLNFVSVKLDDRPDGSSEDYKLGNNLAIYGGAFVKLPFNENFSFKPSVDLMVRGGGTDKQRVDIYYVDLPLTFQYDINDKLYVDAGPVASLRAEARTYAYGVRKRVSIGPAIEPFSFGLSAGAGYFVTPKLSVHALFYRSLNKAWDTTFRDINNMPDGSVSYFPGNISLGVEYFFRRNK